MASPNEPLRAKVRDLLRQGRMRPGQKDGTASRVAAQFGVTRQRVCQVVRQEREALREEIAMAPLPVFDRRRSVGHRATDRRALIAHFGEVGELHVHRTSESADPVWKLISQDHPAKCGTDQCVRIPLSRGVKSGAA